MRDKALIGPKRDLCCMRVQAATLAGVWDLATAIELVQARGRLLDSLPNKGRMLAARDSVRSL